MFPHPNRLRNPFRRRPPLLRRWIPVFCVTTIATFASGCDSSPTSPFELEPEVIAFTDLMNAHRTAVGCDALEWNGSVAQVALAHSEDMIARDYFAHTNPDGASPFDRLDLAGITFSRAAENIAWGYPTGEAVLTAWLDSPGHRTNLENCSLTQHGVGLVGTHWTHLFVTP